MPLNCGSGGIKYQTFAVGPRRGRPANRIYSDILSASFLCGTSLTKRSFSHNAYSIFFASRRQQTTPPFPTMTTTSIPRTVLRSQQNSAKNTAIFGLMERVHICIFVDASKLPNALPASPPLPCIISAVSIFEPAFFRLNFISVSSF